APDLIIGMDNGGLSIDYDEIAEIAPTVILKIAEPTDAWDNYPVVADILDLTSDFEKKNADVDEQLAAIKTEFGDELAKLEVTSLSAWQDIMYADTSKSLTWRRLDAAGFVYNPKFTDNPERYAQELSLEDLADFAD